MGASANLIKNLLLLSDNIYFPFEDRLSSILNQYPSEFLTNKYNWTNKERELNQLVFGTHFLMSLTHDPHQIELNKLTQPVAFVNHSLFWEIPTKFKQMVSKFKFIVIMPSTNHGLEWQVRSAFEKVYLPNNSEYDFCFSPETRQDAIKKYIQQHGKEQYDQFNVFNMRLIFKQQQESIRELCEQYNIDIFNLEDLIVGDIAQVGQRLEQIVNINLDISSVTKVIETWRSLHWEYNDTLNWTHSITHNNLNF